MVPIHDISLRLLLDKAIGAPYRQLVEIYEQNRVKENKPFLSRLLLRLPGSLSSLSAGQSFLAESMLSQLIWRLIAAGPSPDGRYSGVFLADGRGVLNCLGVALLLSEAGASGRLTLVKPALTAVNPPELMAVKPPDAGCGAGAGLASVIGVSRSESLA